MKRVTKGQFGYLEYKKRLSIIIVVVMLALVLATYFIPLLYFGTNQNWFSIIAALICLPTAKFIVNLVLYIRARGCSTAFRDSMEEEGLADLGAFELYMTGYQKNFALSHVFVAEKCLIALTEDPSCDTRAGENHIRKIMLSNGFHGYTVKIFDRPENYLQRLVQVQDQPDPKEDEIMELCRSISI